MTIPLFSWKLSVKKHTTSLLFALYLLSLSPKLANAEDSITYKYEDYAEDDDRIQVKAHYLRLEKDFSLSTKINITALVDSISGATPTGALIKPGEDTVPMAFLSEEREAAVVGFTHVAGDHTFTFEANYSTESDYDSKGGSISYKKDFNKKNTTLQIGYSFLDDSISVPGSGWLDKDSSDFLIGITQIVDPSTVFTANFSLGTESGYLADPYKGVEKDIELLPGFFVPVLFPENRPSDREKKIVYLELLRDFDQINASSQVSYRLFKDDADITAHTWTVEYFQKIGDNIILRPIFRYHRQEAADFYYANLNLTDIDPTFEPTELTPKYSSDHRLSALETTTWGLKAIYFLGESWEFDINYQRYSMKGKDQLTHDSAYSSANIFTIGTRWWF